MNEETSYDSMMDNIPNSSSKNFGLSVNELLKPRYNVIADFPDNKDFPIGKIINFAPWPSSNLYWEHSVEDCQGKRTWLEDFFKKYPHLFKSLAWWEERSPIEMPQYVKFVFDGEIKSVHKVATYMGKNIIGEPLCQIFCTDPRKGTYDHAISSFIPATETEYTSYINMVHHY